MLPSLATDPEWATLCERLRTALEAGLPVVEFANSLGLNNGVSGYSYHSVPVALYAWLQSPDDFQTAMVSALNCGGDTDTVGAMVGALAGVSVGSTGIPAEWLDGICEWPRSVDLLSGMASRLAEQKSTGICQRPVRYFWPGLLPRNLLFLFIVLTHGLGRLGDGAWARVARNKQ